jgi:AcrR family transcriptional regulator
MSIKIEQPTIESATVDPRIKRTRRRLRQAMMALLGEKTLNNITVQDIAARADVNRATFYAHFDDKYALLNDTVRETFNARLKDELPPNPAMNLDNVHKLIMIVSDFMDQAVGPCMPRSQFTEHAIMVMQVQTSLYETIREWMSQVETPLCEESEAAARMLSWAIWGPILEWAHEGRKMPRQKMVAQVIAPLKPLFQHYASKVHPSG